jgi:tRNA pseudouridine38-40 synthase
MNQRPPRDTQQFHAVLRIEYDGSPYSGWARQPDRRTIEGDLLHALAQLGCTDVQLRCAGRTDTGVHATAQVADVRYAGSVPPSRLARALFGELPRELAVVAAADAPAGFDARADATSRAYEYRVLARQVAAPLRRGVVLHHPRELDRELLHAAADAVRGQHFFRAFTIARTGHTFFDRTVLESAWFERGDELVYGIRANAFLRRMVRMLVGTMLAVARGELLLDTFVRFLDEGDERSEGIVSAPAHGLTLVDVTWEPIAGLPLPPRWRAGRPSGGR